jgi:hypothetical protein
VADLVIEACSALPSFLVATKEADTRYTWFVEQYGPTCWELDALSPVDLGTHIEETIKSYID